MEIPQSKNHLSDTSWDNEQLETLSKQYGLKLVKTEDGSLSCHHSEASEWYHNRAGAYTEALENYVKPAQGVEQFLQHQELAVLDVCFGMGYNSWVLIEQILKNPDFSGGHTHITAIETDPQILAVNPLVLSDSRFKPLKNIQKALEHNIYYQTQTVKNKKTPAKAVTNLVNSSSYKSSPGNKTIHNLNNTTFCIYESKIICYGDSKKRERELIVNLQLIVDDLKKVVPELTESYDLIFHDAFTPWKYPELWSENLFQEYYRLLKQRQGKLLTYSRNKMVLENLERAGFAISKTPGVGKKKGGTMAAC